MFIIIYFLYVICPQINPAVTNKLLINYIIKRPSFLLLDNHLTSIFIENSYVKIYHAVAIYRNINNVKPSELKNLLNQSWNSRAKFLIWIMEDKWPTIEKDLENALIDFWSLDCLDVVFMIKKNNSSDYSAFTYDPFVTLNNKGNVDEMKSTELLFPIKLNNLHQYPISVSMYQAKPTSVNLSNFTSLIGARGIDVEAIRYLSTWINFTIVLKSADVSLSGYSLMLPDGTVIGPVGDIIQNRSEILGNPQIVNSVIDRDVEFLRPFGRSSMMIAVPKSDYMPGIARLFRTVDHYLTVSILVAWAFLMLCLFIIGNPDPILETFRIIIHQHCHNIRDRVSERIFLISWIIWAFILASAHQVYLMKALTDPPYYPNINTLDEFVESDLTVVLDPIVYHSLNYSDSILYRKLIDKAEVGFNFDACLKRLMISEQVACVTEQSIIDYQVLTLNKKVLSKKRRNAKTQGHIVKSPLSTFWTTLVVKKGFPYLDKFNRGYQNIIEFGLIIKWHNDITRGLFRPQNEFMGPLNIVHFEGIFNILMIGMGITLVVFIGEIVVSYIKYKTMIK